MRPTGVEPVNESLRTIGLLVISAPIKRGSPTTTLNTPAGTPARCASSASASADNGVASAGFTIIAQPAASAGATLRVIIAAAEVHGGIAAQTPSRSFLTSLRLRAGGEGS